MPKNDDVNELINRINKPEEINIEKEQPLLRISIVDDEEVMRNLLADVLSGEGYKVSAIDNPESAIEKVSKGEVEILITDIKMKGMNGIDLLRRIKEIDPGVDVIVMTGYASVETAVESMKLGAIDYLTKPLNIDHIRIVVRKTVEQRILKRRADESDFYRKLSQIDGLTELFNHRFFQQLLEIEIARADREQWALTLIMIDIDDFKIYNDKNGHPMGDMALKKLSWVLKKSCRKCDFVARYGGEEFVLIIPHADKKVGEIITNRIRKNIESARFENEEVFPHGRFTVSFGIAEYPKDAKTREEFIEKTDQALYQAKNSGKNKVVIYTSPFYPQVKHT